jgi:hypothetical protein
VPKPNGISRSAGAGGWWLVNKAHRSAGKVHSTRRPGLCIKNNCSSSANEAERAFAGLKLVCTSGLGIWPVGARCGAASRWGVLIGPCRAKRRGHHNISPRTPVPARVSSSGAMPLRRPRHANGLGWQHILLGPAASASKRIPSVGVEPGLVFVRSRGKHFDLEKSIVVIPRQLPGTLIAASQLGCSSSIVSSLARDALRHAGDESVRRQLLNPQLRPMLVNALSHEDCASCLQALMRWWELQR